MTHPAVTVYIANHNYGRFIDQSIQSVLKQTYRDFELIIIDDGSTDSSRSIIESYEGHPQITTIFQHNRGLNITNNIALRTSRGRYIMRLDADDYLDENALSVMAGVLERHPDTGLVFPDYYIVDDQGDIKEVVRRHDFNQVTLMDQAAHGACTMIRKDCLLTIGGYDEAFTCQDGYSLWLQFIRRYGIRNVNLPLFYYRRHDSNITRNEERILDTRRRILEKEARKNGRKMSAVAFIPVRGPAADPESPALRLLGKRPLIDWTIQAAINARRLSGLVVTTPDDATIDFINGNYDGRVMTVRRDRKLAMPNTFIEDTVFHALECYTAKHAAPDIIMILFIESPFRSSQSIDMVIDSLELFGTDIVIMVRPDIDILYQHQGAGLNPLRNSQTLRLEREELYREVGQARAIRRSFLENHRKISGGSIGHVIINQHEALRLRSDYDWRIADLIAGSTDQNLIKP